MNIYRNINMITCGMFNCYILRCIGGEVLIDTGTPEFRDEIETWLLNYNVRLIVLTSGYNDCIGNAAYFSELYNAPIAMSGFDLPLINDNCCRNYYMTNPHEWNYRGKMKKIMKMRAEKFKPDHLLSDGDRLCDLMADGVYMTSEIVELDGHTRGTIGILDGNDLYCGNSASGITSFNWPLTCESPLAAKRSLNKIKRISPDRLFFGHGKPMFSAERSLSLKF